MQHSIERWPLNLYSQSPMFTWGITVYIEPNTQDDRQLICTGRTGSIIIVAWWIKLCTLRRSYVFDGELEGTKTICYTRSFWAGFLLPLFTLYSRSHRYWSALWTSHQQSLVDITAAKPCGHHISTEDCLRYLEPDTCDNWLINGICYCTTSWWSCHL